MISVYLLLDYRLTRTLREYATTIQGFSLCVEISGYFSWQKINVFHLSFDLQLPSFHVRAWFAGIKADWVG